MGSRSTTWSSRAGSAWWAGAARGDRLEVRAQHRHSTLQRIAWTVGRTGHLVPLAQLEPVQVSGVTVKLATLHNEEDPRRKDVREGDEVIVMGR